MKNIFSKLTRSYIEPASNVRYTVKDKEYIMPDIEYIDCPLLLTQNGLNEAYDLMKTVHDIFVSNDIKYFAQGGTLLGCIRHGGVIPWDDDIDISVSGDQETCMKIRNTRLEFLKNGYILLSCAPGFAIQRILNPRISLDVFLLDCRNGNDYLELSYPYVIKNNERKPEFWIQDLWPWNKYPVNFETDLILKPFFDYEIYVPYNYNEILEITYQSKDFMTVAKYSENQSMHLGRYFRPLQPLSEKIGKRLFEKKRIMKYLKQKFN